MADFLKTALECLKLAPRYLIAIGLVAGLILFGSDGFRETLGLSELSAKYRPVLGILFLSSLALLIVAVGTGILRSIKKWRSDRKFIERMKRRLHHLNEGEKQILRYYLAENTRANTLRIDDGEVQGLAGEGIIFRSSTVGNLLEGFSYNINEIAWDYLHENSSLLEGSTNTYRTDKHDWGF